MSLRKNLHERVSPTVGGVQLPVYNRHGGWRDPGLFLWCLVHNHSGMVIPAHVNVLDGISDRVQGIPNVPLGAAGAYEWVEFAWLNS